MREDGQRTCFVLGQTPGAGRILLWDDFESLFKWGSLTGFPTPPRKDQYAFPFDGNWAMRLQIRRVFPDGYIWYGVGRSCVFGGNPIVSIEGVFYVPVSYPLPGFGFYCEFICGRKAYRWGFQVDGVWGLLDYYASTGGWVRLGTGTQVVAWGSWHRLSLVADTANLEYVSMVLDGESYSMGGIGMYNRGTVGADKLEVGVLCATLLTGPCNLYVDDVLVRCV